MKSLTEKETDVLHCTERVLQRSDGQVIYYYSHNVLHYNYLPRHIKVGFHGAVCLTDAANKE